jgi:oxepin-CoA hydrolase/3-oxo-5,6-dehydrosuberyl-CoA semialdehyde dehydrogenase
MKTLKSYVCGRWVEGEGEREKLVNPTTEEVLAEAGSKGVDFEAALEYARERGNPALREMSFASRGRLLGEMSKAIHAHREELVELAIANGGNTRGDAKFDLDGATGTMAYYAALGEQMGDAKALTDGETSQLGRNPRFVADHVYLPLTGAAIFINAFNFPAWGFGEKAACAILAGMPVVNKPATSTALVAHRMAEILVDAGVMPEGTFQFVAGSAGDMLDHVTAQDVVAFTGSSATGEKIRQTPAIVRNATRVNVEADSLNAAVLGPDVEVGSEAWDLFIRETAREMTQKAGQKCTATRRIYAPEATAAAARDDLAEALRRVKVGDPSLQEVKMGPLATARQLGDVREGVERLSKGAEYVTGDGGRGALVGVEGERGFFMSPILFYAPRADAEAVNAFEVFGPVATLMPYSGDASEAVEAVRMGGGGLVASVYTDDLDFAREMVLGIAPYHGRLNIGGAKVAEYSMGPGTVLPQTVHGGPGRAGGGEELGGVRGTKHFMQRVAIQGYRPLLEKLF